LNFLNYLLRNVGFLEEEEEEAQGKGKAEDGDGGGDGDNARAAAEGIQGKRRIRIERTTHSSGAGDMAGDHPFQRRFAPLLPLLPSSFQIPFVRFLALPFSFFLFPLSLLLFFLFNFDSACIQSGFSDCLCYLWSFPLTIKAD
jgi:hypothetical protein